MDQRKIDYLKKYMMKKDGYVRLISTDEIGQIDTLPKAWYEIFRERTIKPRIQILLGIWKRYLGTELRNTISYLNNYLENIELMEIII